MLQENLHTFSTPIENVFLSEFDALSAEDEMLTNIRRNFFANGRIEKKNHIFKSSSGDSLCASYAMYHRRPLRLNVKRGKVTVMRSKKLKGGAYSISFYSRNGILLKTCEFSADHDFRRITYFDGTKEVKPTCIISFEFIDGERVITLIKRETKKENLLAVKPPEGTDVQFFAEQAGVNLPVMVSFFDKKEFYATQKDIDAMIEKADKLHNNKEFVPSDTGFGFTPEDFSKEETPKEYPAEDATNEESTVNSENEITDSNENTEPVPVQETDPMQETDSMQETVPVQESDPMQETVPVQESDLDPVQESDPAQKAEEPVYVINSANEEYLYYGEIDENGDRTGLGRMTLNNGIVTYYGNYIADERTGFGAYYYKSGNPCYFGNWKNNKRNGFGVGFRSSDGDVHAGNWNDNKPDGIGVRFDESGAIKYIADFTGGQRDGFCISFDNDGNLVITKYKNGEQLSDEMIIDLNDFK